MSIYSEKRAFGKDFFLFHYRNKPTNFSFHKTLSIMINLDLIIESIKHLSSAE